MQNVNRVVLTGNLTRDPELRAAGGGLQVCSIRLACNGRRKSSQTGEWEDQPNFFDVTVFGAQAENCHKYLAKGRPIAVDGRLHWREWTTDGGDKRQAVQIVAESVQFLSDGRDDSRSESRSPAPAVSAPLDDDDIPF